ncbi:MAG: hypothetical protein IJZ10_12395 [Thermoguttaceae bacterium]|nr:hypothetical protein [Thermoguttaceae bacterium]
MRNRLVNRRFRKGCDVGRGVSSARRAIFFASTLVKRLRGAVAPGIMDATEAADWRGFLPFAPPIPPILP